MEKLVKHDDEIETELTGYGAEVLAAFITDYCASWTSAELRKQLARVAACVEYDQLGRELAAAPSQSETAFDEFARRERMRIRRDELKQVMFPTVPLLYRLQHPANFGIDCAKPGADRTEIIMIEPSDWLPADEALLSDGTHDVRIINIGTGGADEKS